ncbi:DUF1016 family protein [bacterium]|nr:DUF1016 family protein [bacterium]
MKEKSPLNTIRNKQNFEELARSIQQVHHELATQAGHAVNTCLTMRNWLIGCYIAEYELNGADRARYGTEILKDLADRLNVLKVRNSNRRQLYDYLKFYRSYPQIVQTVSAQSQALLPARVLANIENAPIALEKLSIHPDKLISRLSYSMFRLLVEIEDETKRRFYEVECIQGNWSVRELKRQINSLYYERSGLSINKEKLSELAQTDTETATSTLDIRDPYVFEFLGLKPREVMSESHLEDELLDKIQDFLLELGHGFCFEARQKRIIIGKSYNFVDLVFYHRILKCHILVELKLAEFNHENIGQLNTYVNWYRKNMMTENDNPPIGILLCTDKDHALVEYALAGMDDKLFVSKYQLELPKKEEMLRFIEDNLRI